jgi:CHAT domain-containing protein/tetratricopeptide (TPR) repeat protein
VEVNQEDKHLTISQIERLKGLEQFGEEVHPQPEPLDDELRHLATCDQCQRLLDEHYEFDQRLRSLRYVRKAEPFLNCPEERELLELATGILTSERAEKMLQHVAQCDHCGVLLRNASVDFNDHETVEEQARIDALETTKPEWQRIIAHNLATTSVLSPGAETPRLANSRSMRFSLLSMRWIYPVAVAVSVAILAFGWIQYRSRPASVNQLIVRAYAEQRSMDLRLQEADHSPLRVERGTGYSRFDRPGALLEAESIIGKELKKHSDDPRWLQAKARCDLLEWNFDGAIRSLDKALGVTPNSNGMKIDLATAYFERGEGTKHTADFGTAVELLSEVLKNDPNDRVALFNRAILYERLFLYSDAINDWQHYLKLDTSGGWYEEAHQRLDALMKKVDERKQISEEKLLSLTGMISRLCSPDSRLSSAADHRIEDYIDLVIRSWLPSIFPVDDNIQAREPRSDKVLQLRSLATILAERHHDGFLKDLLQSASNPLFSIAIAQLARAAAANSSGDRTTALQAARLSEGTFASIPNRAGFLRAQFEEIYALQFFVRAKKCLVISGALASEAQRRGYSWLNSQSLIEDAFCSNLAGELGHASLSLRRAQQIASRANYHTLALRAQAGNAGLEWEAGSLNQAWKLSLSGLREYWAGRGPAVRGYAFYSVMQVIAESRQQWFLKIAILQECLSLPIEDMDPLSRGAILYDLGDAALSAGNDDQAAIEFQKADVLFATAPESEPASNRKVLGIIGRARVAVLRGDPKLAVKLLGSVESYPSKTGDNLNSLDLYSTLGEAYRALHNTREAERAFEVAVAICERSTRTLSNRRDRLAWNRECAAAYRPLVEMKLFSGDAISALALWVQFRAATKNIAVASISISHRATAQVQSVPNVERPDASLLTPSVSPSGQDRQTTLTYAVFPRGIVIWVHDEKGIFTTSVNIPRDSLRRLVKEFTTECQDRNSDLAKLQQDGRHLYDLLLNPLVSRLEQGRIIVVDLDDELDSLPIQALIAPTGESFGSEFVTRSSPGFWSNKKPGASPTFSNETRILVVAGETSDPAKGLFATDGALEESRQVAALFRSPVILSGNLTTVENVKKALIHASVFHFVGHAREDVAGNALVLQSFGNSDVAEAPQTVLSVDDFASSLFHDCRLAVLSACATSRGEEGRWIDRESMVIGLLDAGVARVVASRWNADSETTSLMMREFYSRLLSGMQIEASLHEAANIIRRNEATSHPYYWANFEVFGN